MAFYSTEVRQANDDHLSMLSALGGQIGQFMERKRIEQGLRDSEERYRSVIAALDEGIILVDAGGGLSPRTPAPNGSWGARRPSSWARSGAAAFPGAGRRTTAPCPTRAALCSSRCAPASRARTSCSA